MNLAQLLYSFLLFLILSGCSEITDQAVFSSASGGKQWIIDSTRVIGDFTDFFPVVLNPAYNRLSEDKDLLPGDRVLMFKVGEELYVYPLNRIWVEVVNDDFNGIPVVITYCPITESGIAWSRVFGEDTLVFSASGMLYNENLMPSDLNHRSIWSQMLIQSVCGDFLFKMPVTYQIIESTVHTARLIDPDARVIKVQHLLTDGVKSPAIKSSSQANYLGLLNPNFSVRPELSVKLFHMNDFDDDVFLVESGANIVFGDKNHHVITALTKEFGREYTVLTDQFPEIFQDNLGNYYDIFGTITRGPEKGRRLSSPPAYMAQLWAWELFFDNIIRWK